MPSTNPRVARASLAAYKRWHGADAPETTDARRDLAAAKLAAYVSETVAAAPPLTHERADELALLFRTPPGGASE
jgi:hypothetical protein